MDDTASGYSEVEYCVQIRSADVTDGQTVYLRLSTANMATWNQVPAITVSKPARIVQPAADPLGGYSDSPPTVYMTYELTPLTPTIPSDPWETLSDLPASGGRQRIGWFDSFTYDRPEAGTGTTPKPITPDADPWSNLADAPPTIDRRGNLIVALAADPWANLADAPPTIDERGTKTVALSADPWGNLSDSPPTIDKRGNVAVALSPDPWSNLADSPPTVDERGTRTIVLSADPNAAYGDSISGVSKSYSLSGDSMSLADQPPTIQQTGALAIQLTADPNAAYADQVSGRGYAYNFADDLNLWQDQPSVTETGQADLTVSPLADPMTMADQPPTVAMTGKLQIALSADPWENLNDQTPLVAMTGALAIALTPDALANWADALSNSENFAFTDTWQNLSDLTPTIDKQDLASTPKTATPPADDLNSWLDAPNTERRRSGWLDSITVDWRVNDQVGASLTDARPAIDDSLAIRFNLLAGRYVLFVDENGNTIVDENGQYVLADPGLLDNLAAYADTPTVDLQSLGTTPKTATPPADANVAYADSLSGRGHGYALPDSMTLADAAPTLAMTGKIALALAVDPMTIGDVAPTVAMTGRIELALTADPLSFGDLTPIVASGGDLRLQLSADNLANYADTFKQSESYKLAVDDLRNYDDEIDNLVLAKRYPLSDPWANLGDSPPTIAKPGSLTVTPPADAMTMADGRTVTKFTNKTAAPTADAMTMGDRLGVALGFADPWETLNDAMRLGWAFRLSGDAMSMVDQMQLAAGGDLPFSLPADAMTLQDAVAVTYGKSYALSADAMSMGDQPVAYGAGILLEFSDDLDDWQDSRETVEGLAPQLADDLNEYLDEMRIRGIIPAEIIRLSGKLNTSVGLSGKVIDKVGLSGHINGNRIGVSGKLYEGD